MTEKTRVKMTKGTGKSLNTVTVMSCDIARFEKLGYKRADRAAETKGGASATAKTEKE